MGKAGKRRQMGIRGSEKKFSTQRERDQIYAEAHSQHKHKYFKYIYIQYKAHYLLSDQGD